MKVGPVNTDYGVALIAEVGNNHEGSIKKAEELIEAAFAAGADAVKLQTFVPELYVSKKQVDRLNLLKRYSLPDHELQSLLEDFSSRGLTVFSTPFDLVSLERLRMCPLIKISSGDITYFQLLTAAARSKKSIILSSGASTLLEVQEAVQSIKSVWADDGSNGALAVLHCVSAYPAPIEKLNLRAISTLATSFPELVIGYSDHALGNEAAVAAVAGGARIVEKHFTLDKNYSSFRDHHLSASPTEFAGLRERIDDVFAMLGNGDKVPQDVEFETRTAIRRSLALSRSLPAGHQLEAQDVCIVRPGSGLAPLRFNDVVGRMLLRSAQAGHVIMEDDIA